MFKVAVYNIELEIKETLLSDLFGTDDVHTSIIIGFCKIFFGFLEIFFSPFCPRAEKILFPHRLFRSNCFPKKPQSSLGLVWKKQSPRNLLLGFIRYPQIV